MKWLNRKSNNKYDEMIKAFQINYAFNHSEKINDYRNRLGSFVLSKQARLFFLNLGHPEPRGSITFIKYKGYYFGVTNEHCVREKDTSDYIVYVPSKETSKRLDNERVEVRVKFVYKDRDNDLASFLVEKESLDNTKRSFIELYDKSFSNTADDREVILIGVPGERLEYLYPDNDYSHLETIKYNHVTYLTVHNGLTDGIHEVKVGTDNIVFREIDDEKGKLTSIQGMSGGPTFTHSYKTLDISNIRFLGIISNGDPKSGKAYIIDVSVVVNFLENIVNNILEK